MKPAAASATRGSRSRWLAILLVGLIAAAIGAWLGWQRHAPQAPAAPGSAPSAGDGASSFTAAAAEQAVRALRAQSLPDPQGQPVALASFDGRVRVVNFWATWCPPCVEEMPDLSALQRELEAGDAKPAAQILGIGVDSAPKIAEFARKHQIAYPLLVAGASGLDMLRAFGNDSGGLPFTVVIDDEGRVIDRISGKVDIGKLRERLRSAQRAG